jgi:phenylacetate-CoA ligase
VATPDGHRILPHDLYVEVTDEAGRPCAEGERGEVTLTGGRNPFLPLLRYRTGDWASLVSVGGRPHLIGLEGRAPLAFRDTSGRAFNNVDVTNAMRPLELAAHTLHQHVDGRVTVGIGAGSAEPGTVLAALRPLFGDDARIEVAELGEGDLRGGKVVQYSSDIG